VFGVMRVQPFKVRKCKLIILLLVMLAFYLHVNPNCLWCFWFCMFLMLRFRHGECCCVNKLF